MSKSEQFQKNIKEFAAVCDEFCYFMENSRLKPINEFVDVSHRLISLLYLKALLLPEVSSIRNDDIEKFVTEEEWNFIHDSVKKVLRSKNQYTVCEENDKQTDFHSIAEDLADIYQDIKDFMGLYKTGVYDMISDGVTECKKNFVEYWGIKALYTMIAFQKMLMKQAEEGQHLISDEFSDTSWENEGREDE